jgi:GDP-D-mannose dehydratase
LKLHYADLTDSSSLQWLVRQVRPDEVYHLAGQSHVKVSFDLPEYTADTTGLGTLRLLEAMRQNVPGARFFLAATSEIFGEPAESPQSESTPVSPVNPYAAAKLYALNLVRVYRRAYGLFACAGILFNHESPRRGENYVTRKIARGAARIAKGLEKELHLGTLTPRRDWGWAPDYVEGMRAVLGAPAPDDYVLATGVTHSVGDFCEIAFGAVGLDYRAYVVIDPEYARPVDITETRGDAGKAARELGWTSRTTFEELVGRMVEAELAALEGRDA